MNAYLKRALEVEGGIISKVASRAGVSRTALSLVINGKYRANSDAVIDKVKMAYGTCGTGTRLCPAIKDDISVAVCEKYVWAIKTKSSIGTMSFGVVRDVCPYCYYYNIGG